MARIRSVKPELRTSLKVASWPREVRYFWVLLWGYTDDYGRGVDEPRLIKADTFPLDDDVTPKVIDEWLDLLARSGVIHRYAVNGTRLLHVTNWGEHQKPQHPKASVHPECRNEHAAEGPHEDVMKPSRATHDVVTPEQGAGSREQGGGAGIGSASPSRRGDPHPLPPDWHPTLEHRALADEHHLDLDAEAFRFRQHAAATDRRMVRWNAAFSQWLSHSATWNRPGHSKTNGIPPPSTTDQRVAAGMNLTRHFQALEEGPQ